MRATSFVVVSLLAGMLLCLPDSAQMSRTGGSAAELTDPGGLIPAWTTMATAWDIPRNPLQDSTLGATPLSDQIRWGYRLFVNTQHEASRFGLNKLSCSNCHLNAGQRENALPMVGIASVFPEYNKREGRPFSLEDRVVGCFWRSQSAADAAKHLDAGTTDTSLPSVTSPEVLALSAYVTWLSRDIPHGKAIPWRGHNVIPSGNLIPVQRLDPRLGESLFKERCSNCHGMDGQGVEIGDKKPGPLWGDGSWNDGAGAARIYTLAGIIRYSMPYINPGSLTDEEAQLIAVFINSKPRPAYPFKDNDYRTEKLPVDAVYYKRQGN